MSIDQLSARSCLGDGVAITTGLRAHMYGLSFVRWFHEATIRRNIVCQDLKPPIRVLTKRLSIALGQNAAACRNGWTRLAT